MAIFGSAEALKNQWPQGERWDLAWEIVTRYLSHGSEERIRAFSRTEGESVKLDVNDGLFLIEEAYQSKNPEDVSWEAHREWADVQVILAGEERMDVANVRNLVLKEDLAPQKDMQYFEDFEQASMLRLEPGNVAIYLPIDAHRPGLRVGQAALVRKLVVKVRL